MGPRLGTRRMMDMLSMGDHGLYVWLAYGITFTILVIIGLRPVFAIRRFRKLHQRNLDS